MSFSFSIKEEDISSTLSAAIDDKIKTIPNPKAKQEAEQLASSIPEVVRALNGDKEFSGVSISGSASDTAASLSVHVQYKQAPATTAAVDEEEAPRRMDAAPHEVEGAETPQPTPKKPETPAAPKKP